MALHDDEVEIAQSDARRLVDSQRPDWANLPLRPAGHGTDNRMFRLGDELLVRLPRRPGTAKDVEKEQTWLPRLAPHLPLQIPQPVFVGEPDESYPFPWSVLRWIDGTDPLQDSHVDWIQFGWDLGGFVEALHRTDLQGARAQDNLSWYRGQRLTDFVADGFEEIENVRKLAASEDVGLDLDAVERFWSDVAAVSDPVVPAVWLHGDLRTANLVAREGRLVGVIDFGALSIGNPTAEHAAVFELPLEAQLAYRERLDLDDSTWQRARGWKVFLSLLAIPYYWHTWPEFARGGVETIKRVAV